MSDPRRLHDELELADLLSFRPRRALGDRAAGDDVVNDVDSLTDEDVRASGHILHVDDVPALIRCALDYDAAEWILQVAAPSRRHLLH